MSTAAIEGRPSKGAHVGIWVVQVLVGLAFIAAGGMKTFTPLAELAAKMPLAASSPGLLRFIGISELLGGIGVILPAATRIKPGLTPLAGAALTLVMVLAVGYHAMNNDLAHSPPAAVLGVLAAIVAWGRFKLAPIAPRS